MTFHFLGVFRAKHTKALKQRKEDPYSLVFLLLILQGMTGSVGPLKDFATRGYAGSLFCTPLKKKKIQLEPGKFLLAWMWDMFLNCRTKFNLVSISLDEE